MNNFNIFFPYMTEEQLEVMEKPATENTDLSSKSILYFQTIFFLPSYSVKPYYLYSDPPPQILRPPVCLQISCLSLSTNCICPGISL